MSNRGDDVPPGRTSGALDPVAAFRLVARKAWPWAGGLAAVLVVLSIVFRNVASWGDVATWVLAATTLLAFAAVVFAGLVAYQLLTVESARDMRAEEERTERREADRRGQAAKVSAWYGTWRSRPIFRGAAQSPMPEWPVWGAVIRNSSDLPVYDVRVSFSVAADAAAGLGWRPRERYSSPGLIPLVPPGAEERNEIPDDVRKVEAAGGTELKWLVAIQFTDAAGTRWLRDARGRLTPADAAAPTD
jgi:arabinogalactan oligomer / maltooligosaccharide transport system substrate-binding protein